MQKNDDLDKSRKYIQASISPAVVKMAEDAGHDLLYSPLGIQTCSL